MRIACIHVPQFALQCVTRNDLALRGAAVCVVGAGGPESRPALGSPLVIACSRAAWALGVRLGMTATSARLLSPELQVVPIDPKLERETTRAIADVLLGASKLVDIGGRIGAGGAHLAAYCEVPVKTRGGSYGDRLVELLEGLGLTARIGIADDRFTAWVAASQGGHRDQDAGVVSVPRGGSAAFLAPQPLSLLGIGAEVQHMLESLGVTNLGEFAALPAPTVARPIDRAAGSATIDYQALARGDSGHVLRPYAPEAPICEEVVAGEAVSPPAAIALVGRRLAMRLEGRQRGAARLEAVVSGPAGERVVPIDQRQVVSSASDLADALSPVVDGSPMWRLRVTVIGEAIGGTAEIADPAVVETEPMVAALTMALSSPGSGDLFRSIGVPLAGAAIRTERRDAHLRSRQGTLAKRRRRALLRAGEVAQPRLFSSGSGRD